MPYTDEDYAGLLKVADKGLEKDAANYGNLPEMTTGNALVDMGLYLTPVGNVMAAGEAARNLTDVVSDLRRGKVLSALGNTGSAALNALWAIPGVGQAGKLLYRGGKLAGRLAKRMFGRNITKSLAGARRTGMNLMHTGQKLNKRIPQPGFLTFMGGSLASDALVGWGDRRYNRRHGITEE